MTRLLLLCLCLVTVSCLSSLLAVSVSASAPPLVTRALTLLTPASDRSIWQYNGSTTSSSPAHYSIYTPPPSVLPPPPAQYYPSTFYIATLNGLDHYVDLGSPTQDGGSRALTVPPTSSWTFATWVWTDSLTTNQAPLYRVLLSRSTSTNDTLQILLKQTGQFQARYSDTTQSRTIDFLPQFTAGAEQLTLRQWTHIGLSYDFSSSALCAYIGGRKISRIVLLKQAIGKMKTSFIGKLETQMTSQFVPFQGSLYATAWFDFLLPDSDLLALGSPFTASSLLALTPFIFPNQKTALSNRDNTFGVLSNTLTPFKDYDSTTFITSKFMNLTNELPNPAGANIQLFNDSPFTISFFLKLTPGWLSGATIFYLKDSSTLNFIRLKVVKDTPADTGLAFSTSSPIDEPQAVPATLAGQWYDLAQTKNFSQTDWNRITLSYDGGTRLNFYINDLLSLALTFPPKSKLIAGNYDIMLLGTDQDASTAILQAAIAQFTIWPGLELNQTDVAALALPYQMEYVHDAPSTVIAGTTVFITILASLNSGNTTLILKGGDSSSPSVVYQQRFDSVKGYLAGFYFLIPSTWSRSTYTITFDAPTSDLLQILPAPICMEVIAPADGSTSIISPSLTVFSIADLLASADWSLPISVPFGGTGCYLELGPSQVPTESILTCPGTIGVPQYIDLLTPGSTGTVPWPGLSASSTCFTFSFHIMISKVTNYLFFRALSATAQDSLLWNVENQGGAVLKFTYTVNGSIVMYQSVLLENVGQWYHIALGCDRIGCRIYIDGKGLTANVWTSTIKTPMALFTQQTMLGIATDNQVGFAGSVASFHFWNRALAYREVTFLAANKPAALQLPTEHVARVAVLGLPSSSQLLSQATFVHNFDRAPASSHGTLIPAPSGASGYHVLSFNGNQPSFDLFSPADVGSGPLFPKDPVGSSASSATWSLWISTEQWNSQPLVIANSDRSSELQFTPQFWFRLQSGNSICETNVLTAQPFAWGPNIFSLATAIWNGPDMTCSYYINGKQVAAGVANGDLSGFTSGGFVPTQALLGGFSGETMIKGNLAHFAYWRRALTGQEIAALARNPPLNVALPSAAQRLTAAEAILASADYDYIPRRQSSPTVPYVLADVNQPEGAGVLQYSGQPFAYTDLGDSLATQTGLSNGFPETRSEFITLSIWLLLNQSASVVPSTGIFHISNGGSSSIEIRHGFTGKVGNVEFVITLASSLILCQVYFSDPFAPLSITGPLQPGKWYNLVASFDGRGKCRVWTNGFLWQSKMARPQINPLSYPSLDSMSRLQAYIGMNDTKKSWFAGQVAQVTLWSRALDEAEVPVLFTKPPPSIARLVNPAAPLSVLDPSTPPPTSSEWLFDVAGVNYVVAPNVGAVLPSDTSFVDLHNPLDNPTTKQTLPLSFGGESFSLSFWLRYYDWNATSSLPPARVFECSTTNSGTGQTLIRGDHLILLSVLPGAAYELNTTSSLVPVPSQPTEYSLTTMTGGFVMTNSISPWHHVTVVFDSDTDQTIVYVNGAIAASTHWTDRIRQMPPRAIRQQCYIAKSRTTTAHQNLRVGYFGFYNGVALRPAQVRSLYQHPPSQISIPNDGTVTFSPTPLGTSISRLLSSSLATFQWQPGNSVVLTSQTAPTYQPGGVVEFDQTVRAGKGMYLMLDSNADVAYPLSASGINNIRQDGLSISFWIKIFNVIHTMEMLHWYIDAQNGLFIRLSAQWLIEMKMNGEKSCVISLDGWTQTIDFTYFHHFTLVFGRDNSVRLYVDGTLQPNTVANIDVCSQASLNSANLAPLPFFPSGLTTGKVAFGGSPLVDGASTYGFAGQLGMINIFSRVLTPLEIRLLASNVPNPILKLTPSTTLPSAPINSAATSSYSWKFAVSSSRPGGYTLRPSSSIRFTGRLNQTYINLTSDNPLSTPLPVRIGDGQFAFSCWIKINNFFATDGGDSLLELRPSTGNNYWVRFSLISSTGNSTYGHQLKLVMSDSIGTIIYSLVTTTVVMRGRWNHIAFVIAKDPLMTATIYLNGAVLLSGSGSSSITVADRTIAVFAYNVDTGKSVMDLEVADISIWDNSTSILMTPDVVLSLYRTLPPQLAGTLGSEINLLLMSAAGRYDCTSPPTASSSLVTWMPGATPGSGYCLFNNDTDTYSNYLYLSTTLDNPNGPIMPTYLTTQLSTIGQGITSLGLSFSFHIRPSSFPAVGILRTLLACSPGFGVQINKLQISFYTDAVKGVGVAFTLYNSGGSAIVNVMAPLPAPLPVNQPMHIAVVVTTPIAGQSSVYYYYNTKYFGSTIFASPVPVAERYCYFGRDMIFMDNKPTSSSNFLGDLGLFTVFTRAITIAEIAQLASYVPPSFAPPASLSLTSVNMNQTGYGQSVKVSSSSPLTCYARPPSKNQVVFESISTGGGNVQSSQCDSIDNIDDATIMNLTTTSLTCSPPIEIMQPSTVIMYTSSAFDYMNANTLLFSSSHTPTSSTIFTPSLPVIGTLTFQGTGKSGSIYAAFYDPLQPNQYIYTGDSLPFNCDTINLTFIIPPGEIATFKLGVLTRTANPGDTYTSFGILFGSNTITMSLQKSVGTYSFTIMNPQPPPPPITALNIVSTTPAIYSLTLRPTPFTPKGTNTYTLRVSMDVTSISFSINLAPGAQVKMYVGVAGPQTIPNSTTMSVGVTAGSPVDLKFTLATTDAVIWTLHVVPKDAFITSLTAVLDNQAGFVQPLTITPALSIATRSYTILSGESFALISFHFTITIGDRVQFILPGSDIPVMTQTQTLRLFLNIDAQKGAWSNFTVVTTFEGTYTLAYYNPPIPITSVIVKSIDYAPQPTIPLPSLLFTTPRNQFSAKESQYYSLITFDTAKIITFEFITSSTKLMYYENNTAVGNSTVGTNQFFFVLQPGRTTFEIRTFVFTYTFDIFATASSTRAIPFTDLSVVHTASNEPVIFSYPISVSTIFWYEQSFPPQLPNLVSYSLLVTCISPCQSNVILEGVALRPLEVGANNVSLGQLLPGQYKLEIKSPAVAPFYPNYTFILNVLSPGVCLSQYCANDGTCIDQPSLTYSTPFTCYCTSTYQGATCETPVTTPYQPTYPTAVIYSSASTITDCLNLTLDGSSSYGLGPAGLHPFFAWSIASIRVQGIEIGNVTDPAYNPTFAATTWSEASSSPLLNGSSVLPSTSAITFSGVKLLKGAIYTFSLRVGNDRESSAPTSVQVESISTESASWTPAVGLRVPSRVTRPDFVIITSQLTPSSCAPLPNDLTSVYLWNVTMTNKLTSASSLLPDVSSIPAASRSVTSSSSNGFSIPSNFFRTGYSYIVTLDLTLTSAGIPARRRHRRLLATSSVITASSTIVPSPSPITARIVGSDRTKPIDAPFIIAADLSFDPDYVNDDVAQPVNAPFYSGLAFTWSCKEVVGGTPCSPQLSTGVDLTQVRVNVPSGMMSIGVTYQWTVLVTSIIDSSRSATATVRVTGSQPSLQSSSKPPLVTILNAPIRMNSDQTLRLSASVVTQTSTSVIDMLYLWSLTCTNSLTPPPIIINNVTTTTQLLPSLQQQSNLGSAVNSSSLVLQPNLLLIPGEYEFSVTVTDPYTTTVISTLTGSAVALATAVTSVTIIVNARPQPGDCSIIPSSGGIALETVFTLTCSNWYEPLNANFAPFTYSIAYRADNENDNENENKNKNKNTNTNTNTGDPTTYQQLTSSSLLTQRSFLLPSGSISLRIVITDQIGASSEFDLLPPITVQVSPHALFDLIAYIANLTYVQLPHVMAAGGDSLASISFIHQIADLVNSARTQSKYQDDAMSQSKLLQFNIDLLESYQQALVTTLELVQSSLDTTTLSIMTQSLIPLTQYAYQLPAHVISNTTLEVKSLLDVGIISTHIDEPGSPVKDLTLVLSNLMTTCSQLDAISHLVHESMRLRQIHAVAGESIELAALNYYAYVERTLVAAGTEVHLPTGESVILTPTAMKNYILRLNQLNISTIDTGGAVGAAEMDTRIVTFSSRWSTCRTQPQSPSISSLTNIEITFPNGDLVDIPSLDTDIVFTIPISKNSTDSILNLAREQLPCPAAPFDEMVVANTSFTCQFWNVTTRSYSSSGCHSLGVTFLPDGSTSLKCSCSHLTEFAILYAEAQNEYNTDVCAQLTDAHLGNGMYLAFLILYSLVGLIAMIQLVRVLTLHGVKKFVFISLEHALILAMCVFRAVNQSMYYTLYKEISISKQIIISSLPYLFYSWIFTLVIVTWASIWATSARGEKNDNPLKPYKLQFFIGNIAITCAFLVIFGLMSQTTDLDSLRTLNRAGVALTCIVEMGFGLFLVVYGLLLVRALTEHFVSAYAKKLGGIAIAFSIAFGVSAAILAYSVAEEDAFARHSLAYNAVYFILDIIGLLLVMFLFAKSISTASGRDKSRGGDGSTTGGGGSSGGRSHNPLSSKNGNGSSAGNSRAGHSRNTSSKQISQRDASDVQLAPLSVQSPISRAMGSQNSAYQPMSPSASVSKPPPSRKQHQPPSFVKGPPTIRPGSTSPPPLPAAAAFGPSSPSMHPLDDDDAVTARPSSTATIPTLEEQQRNSTVQPQRDNIIDMDPMQMNEQEQREQ